MPIHELLAHIFCFAFVGVALRGQEIWKKKYFYNDKENKELDAYDEPQCLAQRHRAESINVEVNRTRQKTFIFLHPINL